MKCASRTYLCRNMLLAAFHLRVLKGMQHTEKKVLGEFGWRQVIFLGRSKQDTVFREYRNIDICAYTSLWATWKWNENTTSAHDTTGRITDNVIIIQ